VNIKASLLFTSRMITPSRNLPSGGRRSLFGAVCCIALSLIPLVVVLVVSDGMIQGITARIIGLSSYQMQILPDQRLADSPTLEDLQDLGNAAAQVEGVLAAYPERQGIGLAAGQQGRTGATIRALDPDIFTQSPAFTGLFTVLEGNLRLSAPRSALLGSKIASDLGISTGQTVRLITLRQSPSGATLPQAAAFTVEGIISSGYQELDARWVFIPLETGFAILPEESSRTFVGVETADAFSGNFFRICQAVENILPPQFYLVPWHRLNEAQFENFASSRTMLLFVMFLIVLVAVVNVSSALVILVIERRREIAILKSLGAGSPGISLSFLLTGLFCGVCGVALGIPLGLLCAVNVNEIIIFIEKVVNITARFVYTIAWGAGGGFVPVRFLDPAYYLEEIPVVLPFGPLFAIAAGTLALSVLLSAFPASRAGSERPIHTLRKV
jgi:lipoprotein-releasing system permease protein